MIANEVSTGSGSDRVITSPRPTLTQMEDPVASLFAAPVRKGIARAADACYFETPCDVQGTSESKSSGRFN
jgi:hypothetical protein